MSRLFQPFDHQRDFYGDKRPRVVETRPTMNRPAMRRAWDEWLRRVRRADAARTR